MKPCPTCKRMIAKSCQFCPGCGRKFYNSFGRFLQWTFAGTFAFFALCFFIGSLNRSSPAPSAPAAPPLTSAQSTALTKAKTEADAKTKWLTRELALLKNNMKNPAAFTPTSVFLTSDGRACVNYRSTNSYGATLQGWAIFEKSGTIWSEDEAESRWNRECAGKNGTEQWTEMFAGHLVEVSPAAVTPTAAPDLGTSAAKGGEAAKLIGECGKPDQDFTKIEAGQPARHVIYKRQNVELIYSRWNVPAWVLTNIFEANGNDTMETAEANRRLPCAAGSIHTVLDKP